VSPNEVPPGGGLAPLRHRGDAMPAQDVAHSLVGHLIPKIGQCSHNPVIAPAGVLASQANHQILDLWTGARQAGVRRCLEPSNFSATSRRYQARMVSGLARRATGAVLCVLNACRFPPGWPARNQRVASLAFKIRLVLILQQEFLVNQSGNVGQKPRACGCVRPQRPL